MNNLDFIQQVVMLGKKADINQILACIEEDTLFKSIFPQLALVLKQNNATEFIYVNKKSICKFKGFMEFYVRLEDKNGLIIGIPKELFMMSFSMVSDGINKLN